MRKIIVTSITFSLLIFVGILWAVAYAIADDGIEFDPALEKYLQEELNTKDLSTKLVLSVDELDLSNLNLTSTKGLEHFKNLKKLNISENVLTDSSFLKELDKLKELDMSFNQFETIELTSSELVELNVRGNRLTDIEFVKDLDQLTYLNIRANSVVDISPVENLTQLQYLNVRGNQVKSLEPLANLKQLTNLNARNNQIHSIEPIIDLPLTERLTLTGNDIDDFKLLEDKLTQIEEIDFELGLPKPKFSMKSGVYEDSFMLEIETEEGMEIYYTLDGSMPNANSHKYEKPIEISNEIMYNLPIISNHKTSPMHDGFQFNAEEVKKGITVTAVTGSRRQQAQSATLSEPISATYILDSDLLTDNNLPVISLRIDPRDLFDEYEGIYVPGITYEEESRWSGNYSQKGREYEKKGSIDFFANNGTLDFNQNIGIRINGRASRRLPQKSLRIYPRSDYGQSRIYTDVFADLPYNEFNLLLLRNSGQDYNSTFLRDGLMHELVKDLEVDVQAYQPAIVLMNGEYWGIHNLREKYNADYLDIKYNVKKEDLVLMKAFLDDNNVNFDIKSGTKNDQDHYDQLIEFVINNDMSIDENLNYVKEHVDLDNFYHYVAYQIYFANTDSFSNNLMIWRKKTTYNPDAPVGHDGRWRWMLLDLDWGMGYHVPSSFDNIDDPVTLNMFDFVLEDENRMALFRETMKNKEAQTHFIEIMLKLLNDSFEPTFVQNKINDLANSLQSEIPNLISRWENIESEDQWLENIQILSDFADKRPNIVRQHLLKEFKLTEDELSKIEQEVIKEYNL